MTEGLVADCGGEGTETIESVKCKYTYPGRHRMTIYGRLNSFVLYTDDFDELKYPDVDKHWFINLKQWGMDNHYTSTKAMFGAAEEITISDPIPPDFRRVTDMSYMFALAYTDFSVTHLNVSNVTNMEGMFWNSEEFNQPLDKWDVSNVTNMSSMFSKTYFNQDLSMWNVSNVTNMSGMFSGATEFNQPLNAWDVSKVTDMTYMFSGAANFNQDLSMWNVSNVTSMNSMFSRATEFNTPIIGWKLNPAINTIAMFTDSPMKCGDFRPKSTPKEVNHENFGCIEDRSTEPSTVNVGDYCNENTFMEQCINGGDNALICLNSIVQKWTCATPCQAPGSNSANPLWVICPKQVGNSQDYTPGAPCDHNSFSEFCDGNKAVYCDNNAIEVLDCAAGNSICRVAVDFLGTGRDYAACVVKNKTCTTVGARGADCYDNDGNGYSEYFWCHQTTTNNEKYWFYVTDKDCLNGCDANHIECSKKNYTPGAPCDYNSFSEFCDGKKVVYCYNNAIEVIQCSDDQFCSVTALSNYADCVYKDLPCSHSQMGQSESACVTDPDTAESFMTDFECNLTTTQNDSYWFLLDLKTCSGGCAGNVCAQ